MIPSDIKVDAKQEIKELVATSYNVWHKYFLKTQIQCETGLYF